MLGNSPVTLHIYTGNIEKLWQQAVDAGAKVTMPLDNQFWGERYGQLTDPYGHHWSVSQQVNMSKKEKDEKQKQAMALFAQNEQPGRTEAAPIVQN
jgi:PhnB protein